MLKRRKFLSLLGAVATVPPMPPGFKVLRSPKDAEHMSSLRKVVSVAAVPVPPSTPPIPPGAITNLTISVHDNVATISWENGVPPFVVERQTELSGAWEATGNSTMARSVDLPVMGPRAFFRVREQVLMPLTGELQPDGLHLQWILPDL